MHRLTGPDLTRLDLTALLQTPLTTIMHCLSILFTFYASCQHLRAGSRQQSIALCTFWSVSNCSVPFQPLPLFSCTSTTTSQTPLIRAPPSYLHCLTHLQSALSTPFVTYLSRHLPPCRVASDTTARPCCGPLTPAARIKLSSVTPFTAMLQSPTSPALPCRHI